MDIAAVSVLMNQAKVQQQAGVSVMKLAMDTTATQGEMLASLLSEATEGAALSVQPHLGSLVDIRV